MVKSMTGFGKASKFENDFEIEIEIRSVNNKFFNAKVILPKELNFIENEIRSLVRNKILRGKIDLRVKFKDNDIPELQLNEKRLKVFHNVYKQAQKILNIKSEIPLNMIFSENDIISIKNKELDNKDIRDLILETATEAILDHQYMAIKEGHSMKIYLEKSMKICSKSIKTLEKLFPVYKKDLFDKYKKNIEELISDKLNEEAVKKITLETSIYVEKADVTEEIIRLKDHIEKFNEKLKGQDLETGKTLNFILQEMQREINTIGSKFNTVKAFKEILSTKEEIEKCREIVQNVE